MKGETVCQEKYFTTPKRKKGTTLDRLKTFGSTSNLAILRKIGFSQNSRREHNMKEDFLQGNTREHSSLRNLKKFGSKCVRAEKDECIEKEELQENKKEHIYLKNENEDESVEHEPGFRNKGWSESLSDYGYDQFLTDKAMMDEVDLRYEITEIEKLKKVESRDKGNKIPLYKPLFKSTSQYDNTEQNMYDMTEQTSMPYKQALYQNHKRNPSKMDNFAFNDSILY